MFDGVHAGHREILKHIVSEAQRMGGESTLLTFWPHPRLLFSSDNLKLITTIDEKIALLNDCGLQNLVICKFDADFANLSPEMYVKHVLVDALNIKKIVIGYDHRFGHRGEGNFELLLKLSKKYNFEVEEVSAVMIEQMNVSSTKVRKAIEMGDMALVKKYLTRDFSLQGRVEKGRQIGRTIGFPTANIELGDDCKIVPNVGVYIVKAKLGNRLFDGIVNIGNNPTIDVCNQKISIEVNLFDFAQNIYGEQLEIYFKHKIRDEIRFGNIDELKHQIECDVAFAKRYFANEDI